MQVAMLEEIKQLIQELDKNKVRYCHWKSNCRLMDSLCSGEDLDLLLHRRDRESFNAIIRRLGYRRVTRGRIGDISDIAHYLKPDVESGKYVHLHVYYKLITVGHYYKNYELPLEGELLNATRILHGVTVPTSDRELFILLIKKAVELSSFHDRLLLKREVGSIKDEVEWLLKDCDLDEFRKLMTTYCKEVSVDDSFQMISAFRMGRFGRNILKISKRIRASMEVYRRKPVLVASGYKACALMKRIFVKLFGMDKFRLCERGAVVAVVGPDASGKSTIVNAIQGHIGKRLLVQQSHIGVPSPTLLTYPLNLCARIVRRKKLYKGCTIAASGCADKKEREGLLHMLQYLMLAYERRALIRKIHKRAADGWLVVCDRYPPTNGGVDGAKIVSSCAGGLSTLVVGVMAWCEKRLYSGIIAPDVLIRLQLPVDIAVERNRSRIKPGKKTDRYVIERNDMAGREFAYGGRSCDVQTNKPLEETMKQVNICVWKNI